MSKKPVLKNFIVVPEEAVEEAWEAIGFDASSGFAVVLDAADEYRAADMTPIFLLDQDNADIYCFAKETFGKKLH